MGCNDCSRDLDLWCSPHARLWDKLTIAGGSSQTYISGSNYRPIVGWLWVWKVAETGDALGTLTARIPSKGIDGVIATDFALGPSGAVLVPFPVVELQISASGGAVEPAIGAYPVDSAHAADMFGRSVQSVEVFQLDAAGGASPSKSITVPTGADAFSVSGPSGASDGCTVKLADASGNAPYLVTFDQNAISHGQQTGTTWSDVLPGGSVTVENKANSAEYFSARFLFELGTFGR
jgi:hypothetical protein